ncbi:MFS-type transporter SLC18B1 [Halotydeus destructor]|nr:MFS-type transporter SLC18B1 [Halotydeus destructor]
MEKDPTPTATNWLKAKAAREKGLTAEQYSVVFGIYSLAQIVFSILIGKYLNHIGAKFVVVVGLAMTGTATILFGFIERSPPGYTFFTLAAMIRCIEGAGFAGFFTSVLAIIVEFFPRDPGYFVGLTETVVTIGMIMGPPLGSLLYTVGGYSLPFIIFGVCMLLTSLMAVLSIRTESEYRDIETDKRSRTFDDPISFKEYLDVLRLPAAILTILCVMCNVIADIFVLITLSSHLKQFNLTTIQIGFTYLCLFLSYGVSSPLAGRLADRTDQEFILQCFGSLIVVGAFLLIGPSSIFHFETNLKVVIIGLLLKGVGAGPLISCSYSSCLKAAKLYANRNEDFKTYTLVSTIISFSIPLGNLIGGFSAGVLYEHFGMQRSSTAFVVLFSILSMLCLIQHFAEMKRRERLALALSFGVMPTGSTHVVHANPEPLCLCTFESDVDVRKKKRKNKRSRSTPSV